jgi:L-threonylcarbamoyladenylate synthase
MKYRHYAPRAQLTLVKGNLAAFLEYAKRERPDGLLCFDEDETPSGLPVLRYGSEENPQAQARQVFARLREMDELGWAKALVRCPAPAGMGLAVYNRLLRAAAFRVVEVSDVP